MKTFAKSISILLMLLLAFACSKEEILLPTGDESTEVLKKAKVLETPIEFEGWSNYKAKVPKTGTVLNAGGPPLTVATLTHTEGQWYELYFIEIIVPDAIERHVWLPLKISQGGVVKGYWPETWYDWGNPLSSGVPNTDLVSLVTGHLGCDLHGPGINKGTIICTGNFDGEILSFVFRFNGLDNGIPSTLDPNPDGSLPIWDQIDGPAIFEFSFHLEVVD